MVQGIRVSTVTLASRDPEELAGFYADLLGLERVVVDPTWVLLRGGQVPLAFELDHLHEPPIWPTREGHPCAQVHLEVQVDDLGEAVAHVLACGGRLASYQPQDDVRVCLDPAGHPFCLWVDASD